MIELPVELLLQATKQYDNRHRHFHKHAPEGGVIVVDTLDGALKEAGEIIAAGIKPTQLIEYGPSPHSFTPPKFSYPHL